MTNPVVHYPRSNTCLDEAVCGRHHDPNIHFTGSTTVEAVTCPDCLHALALDTARILRNPEQPHDGDSWFDTNDHRWYTVRHGQIVPSSAYSPDPTR